MKLTNIGLYSNDVEVANFSFKDYNTENPYVIENIDGLDAETIVPKFFGFATGSVRRKQYDLGLPSRTISLKIWLNPDFTENTTYSQLRDDLYRAIYSSRDAVVQLRLNDGETTIAAVSGFVTQCTNELFEDKQIVLMTIFCEDSRLRALEETNLTITDALVDTVYDVGAFSVIDTDSTLAHGFNFRIVFTNNVSYIRMQDDLVDTWRFTVQPEIIDGLSGFRTGDILYFSSEHNNKYLYVLRGTDIIHLMDKITPGSVWPILFPSPTENTFLINDRSKFDWVSFSHTKTYWGV